MGNCKNCPNKILERPIITEKSSMIKGGVFLVHRLANKTDVKKAVEEAFEVKVENIRIVNILGKIKKVGTKVSRQKAKKKAYVTLKEGYSLNLIEGL